MNEAPPATPVQQPLKIEVSPNIVEHLGLNLYTSLPRVLAEFVANAYDADSGVADIKMDWDAIQTRRTEMRRQWQRDVEDGRVNPEDEPLEERVLPETCSIVIEDRGHGMSRADLQTKFLRIARKRRAEEHRSTSAGGRPVMGRKGIGKLAGFGVARKVTVVTRVAGAPDAIKITLEYDRLLSVERTEQVPIHEEIVTGGDGLEPSGTRIILSQLVFEPTGAQTETIAKAIAQHFAIVNEAEFSIKFNEVAIPKFSREYAFAYPNPSVPIDQLIPHTMELSPGRSVNFQYRVRFTGSKKQLAAAERGVRIYANKRLACAPNLLNLKTGIHGFQMQNYLDAEVHADFIDQKRGDYISSSRQALRWDAPLLLPLNDFLTKEMEKACGVWQDEQADTVATQVQSDPFTVQQIDKVDLPSHRKKIAFRIAAKLAAGCDDKLQDDYYKQTLPIILQGLGYGEVLTAIALISDSPNPQLKQVATAIAELTFCEWDDYGKIVAGRLKAITILERLVNEVDFKKPDNEGELHKLLRVNPWLIDPTFWTFLTSDVTERTVIQELTKFLKVDQSTPSDYDKNSASESAEDGANLRPDLVFALSNIALNRLVIVELKSPNTYLKAEHLLQLRGYIDDAEQFIARQFSRKMQVTGYLIGSKHRGPTLPQKARLLESEINQKGLGSKWDVFDLNELLKRTHDAHHELLKVYNREKDNAAADVVLAQPAALATPAIAVAAVLPPKVAPKSDKK